MAEMKFIIPTFVFLLIFGCSSKVNSKYIADCSCNPVQLTNERFTDTLNRFSVLVPEGNWYLHKNLDSLMGNYISLTDDAADSLVIFSVNEINKSVDWPSREQQQQDIFDEFNVLEYGGIELLGEMRMWNLVGNVDNLKSLMITVEHPTSNQFVTIGIWVEAEMNFKERICELEGIIESFEYY
jgi:hypothetical protein